jgi:hypothetical protein
MVFRHAGTDADHVASRLTDLAASCQSQGSGSTGSFNNNIVVLDAFCGAVATPSPFAKQPGISVIGVDLIVPNSPRGAQLPSTIFPQVGCFIECNVLFILEHCFRKVFSC